MITEQYKYTALSRREIDGKRLYSTPDGLAVPSVTTILDKTKPEEAKAALRNWRKRVGDQKANAISTEAAGRGTRMHLCSTGRRSGALCSPPATGPPPFGSHQ